MENFRRPWIRFAALVLFYIGILVALLVMYSSGSFQTPSFIYQGF